MIDQDDILELFIEYGCDPNTKDLFEDTSPLLYALEKGNFSAAKVLIKNGADLCYSEKKNRNTALHLMCLHFQKFLDNAFYLKELFEKEYLFRDKEKRAPSVILFNFLNVLELLCKTDKISFTIKNNDNLSPEDIFNKILTTVDHLDFCQNKEQKEILNNCLDLLQKVFEHKKQTISDDLSLQTLTSS